MVETKIKNNNLPGQKILPATATPNQKKKRRGSASEYKKSLEEKQALKRLYGLSEKQFKRYVKESLAKIRRVENVSDELIKALEKRLDNAIFRLGFAKTRLMARQLVNHSYFLVNGKPVNFPSYKLEKGDIISIKDGKKKKLVFEDLMKSINKIETPSWLKLDKDKLLAQTIGEPTLAEVNPPVEISLIFEFYSR
ncbi:MAG: 30S ribosomal protein S4 [Patescibacteria group bacterium]